MHWDIHIHQLIKQYGYIALLIGCTAEGETFTIIGGMAAHEKILSLSGVLSTAILGACIGDQFLFWIGYNYGTNFFNRFKKFQNRLRKIHNFIDKYPSLFIIGARFMYGLRLLGPIIIGATKLNPIHFLKFNIIGGILWGCFFSAIGYSAGELIHNNKSFKYLIYILGVIIGIFIIRSIRRWYMKPKQ
ncbi:DedA family protein [Candidatus Ishikawella capsulata]|uniref:Conserved inner membrane protein n=1 Tax=Candidatus Ishikawaella capsulata Mpkobe TaxID=476281 RepID=C5WDP0_9ENTR|nr:DedA family protein [Candidatus Ishikawaella capsulata]BAH83446.1 conserved inner membrane protein [Candidatus Ishikawaella capsulata Mpkobe]